MPLAGRPGYGFYHAMDPNRPPPSYLDRLSNWRRFDSPAMCNGCWAACCTLPVEASAQDLVRLGLLGEDETIGSLKKAARRLMSEGHVKSFRAKSGLFTLSQRADDGSCLFLGKEDRRCTVYERRPDVCRRFPEIGPRPGHCPAHKVLQPRRPQPG